MSLVCFVYNTGIHNLQQSRMSSLSAAKNIICIATCSEGAILAAISLMQEEEQTMMAEATQKIIKNMKTINTTPVSLGKKRKVTANQEEKCSAALIKMKKALDEYEGSDKIDRIVIDFEVGVNYDEKSWEEIRLLHQNLDRNTIGVEYIKLLIYR
jgi:hypothetical protein